MPSFNGRQTLWAIKLFIFDLSISHKSNKLYTTDGPSKRPNYKNEIKSIKKFLFILQQKQVLIKKLINPIFKIIKTIHGRGNYDSRGKTKL